MEPDPSASADANAEARERILKHLEQGAPWDACDAFREAIASAPGDAELLYWGALAHARSGATHQAHALLDQAQAATPDACHLLGEILSLRGRLWKDEFNRAPDKAGAAAIAERARREYLAAYALERDPYPGINAATLSWLLDERDAARVLAREIAARLASQTIPRSVWDHATAGEARLLLGQFDEARRCYAAAYAAAPGDAGTVATMRRQVNLLARILPEAADVLRLLPAADVMAFVGHMIDAPGRTEPRFPAELASAVRAALRERLARLHQPIVYTSAACGADLIFIEAAQEIGAEVNVVLPFEREDFVRTSVIVGGDEWLGRFDAALARASRVIMATEENHLDDDVLFEHAALLLEGLSVLRASQLQTSPTLLCVIDAESPGRVGGTYASFERWKQCVGPPQVIDLCGLRAMAGRGEAIRTAAVQRPSAAPPPSRPFPGIVLQAAPARPQRTLKTLLFADFAGSSRLHDAMAPLFQESFWRIAAEQIDASPVKPLLASTWGDALYVVSDAARECADFALGFLARMRDVDWTAVGLPDSGQIRIALHAGPVFCGFDPIMRRNSYFGSSVTKAARIEPVTPPGMVYASEAFAATLAATGAEDIAIEYVGRLALAKGYGESRIYRLERR
jgi:class 3 adenylate cyclase/tetratricopeptide (TPR) repeat protein